MQTADAFGGSSYMTELRIAEASCPTQVFRGSGTTCGEAALVHMLLGSCGQGTPSEIAGDFGVAAAHRSVRSRPDCSKPAFYRSLRPTDKPVQERFQNLVQASLLDFLAADLAIARAQEREGTKVTKTTCLCLRSARILTQPRSNSRNGAPCLQTY